MASDIFGNEVGAMIVRKAGDAKITCKEGGIGFVMNASINYNVPVQPVASFGGDTIFALSTPQGNFSLGTVAGSDLLKKALDSSTCYGTTLTLEFEQGDCTPPQGATDWLKEITKESTASYTMNGAFTNGLQIQGQATDAFFTQNVTGVFHYLS